MFQLGSPFVHSCFHFMAMKPYNNWLYTFLVELVGYFNVMWIYIHVYCLSELKDNLFS